MPPPGPADTVGHRGRTGDPLYAARRTLHTGADLLTDHAETSGWTGLFADDAHVEVEATWGGLPADDRRLPRARPAGVPQLIGFWGHAGRYRCWSGACGVVYEPKSPRGTTVGVSLA